jgi:uncharacterized membrane protein
MSAKSENVRLETFCDGVFAIAITLLVLEIKVPPSESIHSAADLWRAFGRLWPSFFAFGSSFFMILINWANHHSAFKHCERSSPQFLYTNGVFLMAIVLLPFSTAVVAQYISTPYAQPAIVLYCFSSLLGNIGWNLMTEATLRPIPLSDNPTTVLVFKEGRKFCRYGFFIYLFITVLAWWFPYIALAINTLLWFAWLIIGLTYSKNSKVF